MANSGERIRLIQPGEIAEVCDFVREVFAEFVAPHYSAEGVTEFERYASEAEMAKRLEHNHLVMVAEEPMKTVGMVEVRDFNHISLLFVSAEFQRRGIAKRLLDQALVLVHEMGHNPEKITVNSSPNSVRVYEALGFQADGPERVEHGIRYTSMTKELGE